MYFRRGSERRRTKEEALDELSGLLGRYRITAPTGDLRLLFDQHWLRLSLLAHTIHEAEPTEPFPGSATALR